MPGLSRLQAVFQTLGDANRLKIIEFLGEEERSVSEMVAATGLSQPLVSHHLRILREAGIVESQREGPFVYYRIKDRRLLMALKMFSEIFALKWQEKADVSSCRPP